VFIRILRPAKETASTYFKACRRATGLVAGEASITSLHYSPLNRATHNESTASAIAKSTAFIFCSSSFKLTQPICVEEIGAGCKITGLSLDRVQSIHRLKFCMPSMQRLILDISTNILIFPATGTSIPSS